MNQSFLLTFVLLFLTQICLGQVLEHAEADRMVSGASLVRMNPDNQTIGFVAFEDGDLIKRTNPSEWLRKLHKAERQESFKLYKTQKDQLGYEHQRYQQVYKDIPVEFGRYTLHIRNGQIQSANGEYYPVGNVNVRPGISEYQAFGIAEQYINAKRYIWEEQIGASSRPEGALVLLPWESQPYQSELRLAFKFDLYAIEPLSRKFVFVDAHSGELLFALDQLHSGNAVGTATTYYRGTQTIITDSLAPNNFRLRDYSRGMGIETYDLNESTNVATGVDFTDTDNIWNTTINDDHAANDAHWGAEWSYDYFFNEHGRDSWDDAGAVIKNYVHYGANVLNAFWDGSNLLFGDGGALATPLTSIEIVAHELAHGVTQESAGLIYSYESGALNESFSDIFGVAIDYYADSANANYIIGDEIGYVIRDMSNPNNYNDPDTYLGTYWWTSPGDNGGVHTNSGVQNFWYYLLVEGGSGVNDNGDSYTVTGIGRAAADAIAYRNLNTYLSPNSQYVDARFYAEQAAVDLYGPCSPEAFATGMAWYAVGVGSLPSNNVVAQFTADQTFSCTVPATVTFSNGSVNASTYSWDFGDGTTSTQTNPTHTYTTADTFTVTLIADGSAACGSTDTLTNTNYIIVTSGGGPVSINCSPLSVFNSPDYGITNFSLVGINNSTNGSVDSYQDYSCEFQASVTEGTYYPVSISTSQFYNEDVRIWIDLDNNGIFAHPGELVFSSDSVVGTHMGNMLIPGGAVLNTPLRMRVMSENTFYTISGPCYQSFYGQAEDYTVTVGANSSPPTADFMADYTTINVGQVVNFTDISSGLPSSWQWDFPGGSPSSSTNQNPSVLYNSLGTYPVTLTVTNGFGTDSVTKTAYIQVVNTFTICTDTSTTAPSGILFDSGGPSFNYTNNEFCTFLIDPGCATSITLSFTSFWLESCCDYFRAYDGPDASYPLLMIANGTSLPPPVTANSGVMFIQFTSDGSVVYPGFEASWTSVIPTGTPPTANFSVNNSNPPLQAPVQFTDMTSNSPIAWFWDFGDGSFSTQQNPQHAFSTSGTQTITLIADNCFGLDTITQTLTVQAPPVVSYSPDSIIVNTLNCNDTFTVPVTFYNTGSGALFVENQTQTEAYDSLSSQFYTISGVSTFHSFSGMDTGADSAKIIVRINGDFDNSSEYADIRIEGTFIKTIVDFNPPNGTDIYDSIFVSGPSLTNWLSDGILEVEIDNSANVDPFLSGLDLHEVQLIMDGVGWIDVNPDTASAAPGDSLVMNVTLDGSELNSGTHISEVTFGTNDPTNSPVVIPVVFTISAPAEITLSDTCLDFGSILQFTTASQDLIISNPGCDTLWINPISTTTTEFASGQSQLMVLPGSQDTLEVIFQPTSIGALSADLQLFNNATDTTVCLTGTALGAPIISVTPGSINETLMGCDDSVTVNLTVANTGLSDLHWMVQGSGGGSSDSVQILSYLTGVDYFGEYSNMLFGLNQYFTDYVIQETYTTNPTTLASELNGKDVLLIPEIESGITTQFASFAPVVQNFLSSGGSVLIFGSTYNSNQHIFDMGLMTGTYQGFLSNSGLFLDIQDPTHPVMDLVTSLTAESATARMDFTDPDVEPLVTYSPFVGQDDEIVCVRPFGNGNVIYIGQDYYSVTTNMQILFANAVQFGASSAIPDWISVAPDSGTVASGSSQTVSVTLNASGLSAGTYTGNLIFQSNDPATPEVTVPVTLTLIGEPELTINLTGCLDFPTIMQFTTETDSVEIVNTGCAPLVINSVTSTLPEFVVTNQTITVPDGQSVWIPVDFSPTTVGSFSGQIDITSNWGPASFCVTGASTGAPSISVSPNPLSVTMAKCDPAVTVPVTVYNNGTGNLEADLSGNIGGATLQDVLDELNVNFMDVNGVIPNRYDFTDGVFGFSISDGGNDMYDGGNILNTNFSFSNIQYSDNLVQTSTAFGTTGAYFTRKYPGLFVLAADLDNVSDFYITGNLGADGSGQADGTVLNTTIGGTGFTGFVKRVYNAFDPSVNHLIIIEDNPAASHTFDTFTNSDEHTVSGLNNTTRLYYLLYAAANGGYINNTETQVIMEAFLNSVQAIPDWISVSPSNIVVAPGDSGVFYATFDGTGLDYGTYMTDLAIPSNDPLNPIVILPTSLTISGTSGPFDPVCTPTSTNPIMDAVISNVELNSINNGTTSLDEYEDFTCTHETVLQIGTTYTLNVHTSNAVPTNVLAWIDYNNNGVFDANEEIMNEQNIVGLHTVDFVPIASAVVNTKLRLRIASDGATFALPGPCANVQNGQFEDYTVELMPNNLPPQANFNIVGVNPCEGIYQFNDLSTNQPTSWQWDFGDGSGSTMQNPVHAYNQSGVYSVELISTNMNGSDTVTIQVKVGILDPSFTVTGNLNVNQAVNFESTTTGAVTWDWDFGNGLTSSQETATVVYTQAGTYNVSLTVTDSAGCTATIFQDINIDFADGLGDLTIGTINLYPNPVHTSFWLDYEGQAVALRYRLFNHLGQQVLSGDFPTSSSLHEQILLPANLAEGVYTIEVQANQEHWVSKIVLER